MTDALDNVYTDLQDAAKAVTRAATASLRHDDLDVRLVLADVLRDLNGHVYDALVHVDRLRADLENGII